MTGAGFKIRLREGTIAVAHADRHVIETPGSEPWPEVSHARYDDTHHGHADVWPGLVEHQELHASFLDQCAACLHVVARVRRLDHFVLQRGVGRFVCRGREPGTVFQSGRLPPPERQRIVDRRPAFALARARQPGEALVQFAERTQGGEARVGMATGPVDDVLSVLASGLRESATNVGMPMSEVTSSIHRSRS